MNRFEMAETPALDSSAEDIQQPRDECGVFGIWAPGESVAAVTYVVLNGLQHRGESAAGLLVHDNDFGITGHKGNGKVPEAIPEARPDARGETILDLMTNSPVAVGHVRYSTSAENSADAAQPFKGDKSGIAVAHNGHIEGLDGVAAMFGIEVGEGVSDSHKLTLLLDSLAWELGSVEKALCEVLPTLNGAYCLSITDGERLIAVRDPWGLHPLALGSMELQNGQRGYAVASESVVFASVGIQFERDIEPGEIIVADDSGVTSLTIDRQEEPRRCGYEFIYTARVDGEVDSVPVYDVRHRLGQLLAEDYPVAADVVVGMPDSGMPAAYGYAEASGIPIVQGVVKNPYTGRSFLQRADQRAATLVDKARVIPSQVAGRSLVLVDDSMIKGNSMKANVRKFRDAGAREIHVRIAAPPYMYPCHMGMDTGDPDQLIARNMTSEEMTAYIGADSLAYITTERVQQAVDEGAARSQKNLGKLCMACSTGEYPFAVPATVTALGLPQFRTA